MSIEKLRPSFTFTEDRLKELQAVVPEAFADGKINWDVLREALGEYLEGETQEHFGLSWPGKRDAHRLAAMPSKGTLVAQPGKGVNEESTHNIFIEGDNLEVLKLLQKSYAGRIKMIYIDPPYNTGNDFVYKDDYSQPLQVYLRITKQVNEQGELLTTNTKASGRYHTDWLNMMYPRMLIARSLLRDDGVIFISIDDNEVYNLRNMMAEVFGEENFIIQIPWQSRQSVQNDTDISVNHEYIVGYAKIRRLSERRLKESNAEEWYSLPGFAAFPLPLNSDKFSNPDDDPRGPWKADPFDAPNIRPNLTYTIINPNTGEEYLPPAGRCWRTEEAKYKALFEDRRIVFGKTGNARPQLKVFYEEKKDFGEIQTSWFSGDIYGTSTSGTKELQDIFDGIAVFDSPKPTSLIKALVKLSSRGDDIVLDFFAGSCSTAHAVLDLDREDGKNRRFICVQLPEPVKQGSLAEQAGYRTIPEIGCERIRRVISKLNNGQQKGELLGFKYFLLDSSNFREWEPYTTTDIEQLEMRFSENETTLVKGWQPENLLLEIMLNQGFPLDSQIMHVDSYQANLIQRIQSEFCTHDLFICLDVKIEDATIQQLRLRDQDIFVCLDTALSDEVKIQLTDHCNLKVI
jgi:adenine-specific DNA-methyltransferase